MNSYGDAKKWYLSPECIKYLKQWWYVLHSFWDDKDNIFKIANNAKCFFAIDYAEFEEEGCIKDLTLHELRQRRKKISKNMNKEYGVTLTKSASTHKVDGKNWSIKRKLGQFKEEFKKYRKGNASKLECNAYCDKHGLEDYKVELKEVDLSKKVEPNAGFLQVLCCCV